MPGVCPGQAGVLSKRLNRLGCFSVQRLRSAYLTLRHRVIRVSPKQDFFPLEPDKLLRLRAARRISWKRVFSSTVSQVYYMSVHFCYNHMAKMYSVPPSSCDSQRFIVIIIIILSCQNAIYTMFTFSICTIALLQISIFRTQQTGYGAYACSQIFYVGLERYKYIGRAIWPDFKMYIYYKL